MNIPEKLASSEVQILLREHNIQRLYLVGSYARWQQTYESDIDLVYTISDQGYISGLRFIAMKHELERILWRSVDLVEEKFINRNVKKHLEQDKLQIF